MVPTAGTVGPMVEGATGTDAEAPPDTVAGAPGVGTDAGAPGVGTDAAGSAGTRARILEATLVTLRRAGVVGTSARAIARTGGFNQALIFYHFGSVQELLVAAVAELSTRRMARYRQRLAPVRSLGELVTVGAACHAEDADAENLRVLAQMLAGSSASADLTARLKPIFDPWVDLVEEVVEGVLARSGLEGSLPARDLALGVVAMFMGLELLGPLYDTAPTAERLFDTAGRAAPTLEGLLAPGLSGGTARRPGA